MSNVNESEGRSRVHDKSPLVWYMNNTNLQSLEDVRTFLAGTVAMAFSIQGEYARHDWIEQALRHLLIVTKEESQT